MSTRTGMAARRRRLGVPILAGASCLALTLGACSKAPSAAQNAPTAAAASADTAAAPDGADTANSAPEYVSQTPPPPLPAYDQPPIPEQGDIWTPGYWAWNDSANDYYWTPGTWVQPPEVGLLWTPGFWLFAGGHYAFQRGHWGHSVGFYGGIDYGHGYGGEGYQGGRWQGDRFFYNTAANNNIAAATITNVYTQAVNDRGATGRASFNGGGGVNARPTPADLAAAQESHTAPTLAQVQQTQVAKTNPGLRASVNHGAPILAATSRPGVPEGAGGAANAGTARANGPVSRPPEPAAASQPAPPRTVSRPTVGSKSSAPRPTQARTAGPPARPAPERPPAAARSNVQDSRQR